MRYPITKEYGMNKHLLFVYGTLKAGYPNHHLLKTATFVADYSTEREYTMHNLGSYPAIVPSGNTRIIGELYLVDGETLVNIDALEGYPGWYDRIVITTPKGEALVYTMTPLQVKDSPVILDGLWR
jgi:gamma-glutamylcyclotransferase (GGCT)/AIG2-like uncharacterized protein YtfP